MSEKKQGDPISVLLGELKVQQQLVNQITAGTAPVMSSIGIKKEVSAALSQLSNDVRKLTLDATKHAFNNNSNKATSDIMLDTFNAINELVKKYEIFMMNSLTSATIISSTSKQIAEKIGEDAKETQSRLEAFQRIKESPSTDQRQIGDRPESIRRTRQYESALGDIEGTDKK